MFENIDGFYPTPLSLIMKMIDGIDFKLINTVLEPSAGKGDIAEYIIKKMNYVQDYYGRNNPKDIDCIEINDNLTHILKGKGYRVVHNDFLTFNTFKHYDLVVMNPPFNAGCEHLLKALELQKDGGSIVCLLNAETLRNAYSNRRKDLVRKLDEYEAKIEYIDNAFHDAERKANVDVALIKVNIPEAAKTSTIIEKLKQEQKYNQATVEDQYYMVENNFVKSIIEQYNLEVNAGVNLINEYLAMKPFIMDSFDKENKYQKAIIRLEFPETDRYGSDKLNVNEFVRRVRLKYWTTLFESKEFVGQLTQNLREEYRKKVQELADYDFSLYNIHMIRQDIFKNMTKGVENTIIALFDELSQKYHWIDETSKNIHYFSGWKTNAAHKINKRVIIPLNMWFYDRYNPTDYSKAQKLTDIEKVFNYLDGGLTQEVDIKNALSVAERNGLQRKVCLKYFNVSFYKKGTCHIEFTNPDLLEKFNLFGSQRKGWLPPSYGKVRYKDMSKEEQAVVDEFQGEEKYNEVMANKNYYIVESSQLLQISA